MRRFEFVEGSSSKFWEAEVQGATFTVVYGRIGAAGTRKDKTFATPAEAQREHDKKVAEKLREGYCEVSATGAAPSPAAPAAPAIPAAPAAPALAPLPLRVTPRTPSAASIAAGCDALAQLESEIGGRSWKVARLARRARAALDAVAGIDPAVSSSLQQHLDALLDTVMAPRGARRLPLHLALDLLLALDPRAFARALSRWGASVSDVPAAPAVRALLAWRDALGDDELALRAAALLASRDLAEGQWSRRHRAVAAHLDAAMKSRGVSRAQLGSLDAAHDAQLRAAIARMAA